MCGIIGVCRRGKVDPMDASVAHTAMQGLRRLQHRGYEGAGITVSRGTEPFRSVRGIGLVGDVLTRAVCDSLPGYMAVAQSRYSTSGQKNDPEPVRNLGPLYAETSVGPVAVAHNGNIAGAGAIRRRLKSDGSIFYTATDTEVVEHLIARAKGSTFRERLMQTLVELPIAYAFVMLSLEGLHAMRDAKGIRPLSIGCNDEYYIVASETSVFRLLDAVEMREVEPGEVITITPEGIESAYFATEREDRPCMFEYVYFARPDHMHGAVKAARFEMGRMLARHHRAPEGIVVGVPESGLIAASGYAHETKEDLRPSIVRDHFEHRAFMHRTDEDRELANKLKHSIVRRDVKGKSVTLIDDSLVRGHTMNRIAALIRDAGATAVHVRFASPMVIHPCHYGIDTPTHRELFANQYSTEYEMARALGADSVEFLTLEELRLSIQRVTGKETFCSTCFDGKPLHI